jgi:hypothetical protein
MRLGLEALTLSSPFPHPGSWSVIAKAALPGEARDPTIRAYCQAEHPLYASGDTASVPAPSIATMARDYRQQPIHVS